MVTSWGVLLLVLFSLLVTAENTNPDLFDDEEGKELYNLCL